MRDKGAKGNILTSLIIAAFAIAILFILVNMASVDAGSDAIVLKGLYGKTIPYTSILSAELYETDLPLAMVKVNGIGLGFIEIGFYRIKDLGAARLFVLRRQKPYLLLRTSDDTILIGLGAEKNKKLFERIRGGEGVHQ
ncbi:MAG: PH domain-containing protein [Spirochaetales bacterium]|jgi:hypothetical protein